MKYFDSHAHYYDERFESECDVGVDKLIDALLSSSVSGIINVGTSPETCRLAIDQAKKRNGMYSALGIHPSDSQYLKVGIDEALSDVEGLIKRPENKCVALGEIGLDYHYPDTDKACQMKYFKAQMSLAAALDIPVVIHDREAHGDIMDVIREFPGVRGVLHSYSGSPEMAEELVRRGYMISFSGTLTFTNARRVKEVAQTLPRESVLIETDCPYLAPHPHRGKLNHSGYLEFTNRALSEIFGISEEECAELTEMNARRFFGI
ncbi:MAG: TatD family deoxyribonuclease [Ruminococcaceae bacterium]|nr:TatD family deoxyribonuclease [Oscillospiraceae bacterium]